MKNKINLVSFLDGTKTFTQWLNLLIRRKYRIARKSFLKFTQRKSHDYFRVKRKAGSCWATDREVLCPWDWRNCEIGVKRTRAWPGKSRLHYRRSERRWIVRHVRRLYSRFPLHVAPWSPLDLPRQHIHARARYVLHVVS